MQWPRASCWRQLAQTHSQKGWAEHADLMVSKDVSPGPSQYVVALASISPSIAASWQHAPLACSDSLQCFGTHALVGGSWVSESTSLGFACSSDP